MASYEVEHNIKPESTTRSRHRPDMSTFFARLDELTTSSPSHQNPHAVPTPGDLASLYSLYADSLRMMRGDGEAEDSQEHDAFYNNLINEVLANAEHPPTEVKGLPQSFLDELDRVDKRKLKKDDTCPICGEAFLDDKYPLVVALPCHKKHWFDLDCIAPWLKLQGTCPLDRKDLGKKKVVIVAKEEEEDGEYDEMYA